MKAKNYVFTLNNYTEEDIEKLNTLEVDYIMYGKELAPTTGTPHLQGYVSFVNERHWNAVKKLFKWWCEPAGGSVLQNEVYTSKDYDWYERGTKPKTPKERGAAEKQRWDDARSAAKRGAFDEIPSDIYIRYFSNLKRIHLAEQPPVSDMEDKEHYGCWIYGVPGSGKSTYAKANFAPLYDKMINEWWDDYDNKENVLIQEWAPQHKNMIPYLKVWVDKWRFRGEVKNGSRLFRPPFLVITSNYSIDECITGVDAVAIKRRFKVIYFPFPYGHASWPGMEGA